MRNKGLTFNGWHFQQHKPIIEESSTQTMSGHPDAPQVNVLLVGSGGREHSLAWRMSQSDSTKQVYVAPGNPGTEAEDKVTNVALNTSKHSEVRTPGACMYLIDQTGICKRYLGD